MADGMQCAYRKAYRWPGRTSLSGALHVLLFALRASGASIAARIDHSEKHRSPDGLINDHVADCVIRSEAERARMNFKRPGR
jgi:hypothetical protein